MEHEYMMASNMRMLEETEGEGEEERERERENTKAQLQTTCRIVCEIG